MKFTDYLEQSIEKRQSLLCAGFDLRLEHIPEVFRSEAKDLTEKTYSTLTSYYLASLEALEPHIACIKPNIAFFEQYGIGALKALQAICTRAKELSLPVVMDAKRGDIGSTNEAYANAFLGPVDRTPQTSGWSVDSLTVNPFLGLESVKPFLESARANDKGIFLLVRTSNPDAAELQDSKNGEGETLSERVARFIRENESSLLGECGISALGAVVGATRPEEAKALRKLMPKSLFLVPGFGAQGGGAADALAGAISGSGVSKRGVIINSSRGIFALEDMNSLSKEEFQSQIAKRAEEQKIALAK